MTGGFDFNQWQQMQAGQQSGDGGGTPTGIRALFRILGLNPNVDQGGIKDANVGTGFSPTSVSLIKWDSGGGLLSMIWDEIKKFCTRELPPNLTGGEGGAGDAMASSGSSGSDSAFGDGGSGIQSGGSALAGGDSPAFLSNAAAPAVEYGDKLLVAGTTGVGDYPRALLGEITPQATPASGMGQDAGMGANLA